MIKFIADIGSNHNQDFMRCQQLIKVAKQIGCWGVKFQLFRGAKLYQPNTTMCANTSRRELPRNWVWDLCIIAHGEDIKIGFSVFDFDAVTCFYQNNLDFIKIGSYELLWLDLIRLCAKIDKHLILSTGMGSLVEIGTAVNVISDIRSANNMNLTLLHCNSQYPAKSRYCGLKQMLELDNYFNSWFPIGWSDHTKQPGVILGAAALGVRTIEFHLDLDGQGWEYSCGHCWLPNEIEEVIKQAKHMLGAFDIPSDKYNEGELKELRMQRTDPSDGMRPLKEVR